MTTTTWTLSSYGTDAVHAPSPVEAPVVTPNTTVANPFARRPLGKSLSRHERAGILIIFAILATVTSTALVRGDRAWRLSAAGTGEVVR